MVLALTLLLAACKSPPCMEGFLLNNEGTCVRWEGDPSDSLVDTQGEVPDDSGPDDSGSEDSDDSANPGDEDLVLLTGGRLLRRISLDLRGVLPTLASSRDTSDPRGEGLAYREVVHCSLLGG